MAAAKLAALLVCLAWQGPAHAQPPAASPAAALRVVSGANGALELRAGERRLAEIKVVTPVAKRGEPRVREAHVEGRRVVEVQVPIRDEDAAEAWVGAIGSGGASPIWTGRLGAVDPDGEVARHLALEAGGLSLYQAAGRIAGCDGQRVRLFERRYDFASRRFKAVATLPPPGPGPVIVVRRGGGEVPAGRPRISFPFTTTSAPPVDAGEPGDVGHLVAPLALNDGDPETVWAEGDAGDGRGEVLTARSGTAGHAVVGLRVLPGDTRSAELLARRARPRALSLILGPAPEQRFEVVLEEREPPGPERYRKPFWIPLPRPVVSSCVTIVVREVTPGTGARDRTTSAWGDIDVFTDLDGEKGVERLVAAIEGPDCEPRVADVVAVGAQALPGLAQSLGRVQGGALDCVLEALGRLAQAQPLPDEQGRLTESLLAALGAATPEQERPILTLLARLREPPVERLAARLRDGAASGEERARAARGLAALDRTDAWPVLLGHLGEGPPELRAILRGLCGAAPDSLVAPIQSAIRSAPRDEIGRRADLVWVLGALAGRAGRPPRPEVGALLATLAGERDEAFEVRARALAVLGHWPDEGAVGALEKVRAASPDAALRLVAVRALAARPEAAATTALRAAIADADPGVRQVAAERLGARRDREATPLLIGAAKQEPWPAVRRAEIAALGELCGPGASDLIVRAIERDVDDVRRAALRGLVSCKDGRAPARLLSVLSQPREKSALRNQAALLLFDLKDRSTAPGLAGALERLLVEAQADLALEATATATLRALAEVGGPVALQAALKLRSDPRPVVRRSASEALGRLCDPGAGAQALRAATRDPDAAVAAAAAAALRRCGAAQGRNSGNGGQFSPGAGLRQGHGCAGQDRQD